MVHFDFLPVPLLILFRGWIVFLVREPLFEPIRHPVHHPDVPIQLPGDVLVVEHLDVGERPSGFGAGSRVQEVRDGDRRQDADDSHNDQQLDQRKPEVFSSHFCLPRPTVSPEDTSVSETRTYVHYHATLAP